MKQLLLLLSILFFACTESTTSTAEGFEQIELPDHSVVLLNKHSSLKYDAAFADRKVKLQGEAFFDVVKGDKPFTVITELGDIQVLGTQFSVKSDAEQLEIQVKEGLVELKNSELMDQIENGMKATLKKGQKQLKKAKADMDFDAWVSDLEKELKELGVEIKRAKKVLKKEGKKLKKEMKKESEKIGKEIKEESEKLKEKLKSAVEE